MCVCVCVCVCVNNDSSCFRTLQNMQGRDEGGGGGG